MKVPERTGKPETLVLKERTMIEVKYILMPVLGGIIGYITNDIAIKMLFRPRRAIYIGKWKLPFTPGLIPQQKDRIARSIGTVVSAQLLNAETLRASVLSDESLNAIRMRLLEVMNGLAQNEASVKDFVSQYVEESVVERTAAAVKENLERVIVRKMTEADIGTAIVERSIQKLMDRLRERLNIGLQTLLLNKEVTGQIETVLAAAINDWIKALAPDIVHTEIDRIGEELLDRRVCDLYQEHRDKLPEFADRIVDLYEKVLESNMEKLVHAVDIGGIVYKKVAAFDAEQLENLIFGIMKRELRAIVYLGALLGFLMGFLNILLL